MKKFEIPVYYRSSITGRVKESRKAKDHRKQDFSPAVLDFGPVQFFLARHFGFCYGVENAIEISYRALEENQDKNVYLLSQMIHNPEVNADLQSRGIKFISDTDGTPFISWNNIGKDDIVIIPAFGTTLEIENLLLDKGVEVQKYNTTCPFVEKVWTRAEKLGRENYTIVIHGKAKHEETRATFSHSNHNGSSVIIQDMNEARLLAQYISGEKSKEFFYKDFEKKYSPHFDVDQDLNRIGVVNQTTMLASETQDIADFLKQAIIKKFGETDLKNHFADTRDTLCYATNDNQDSTYELLKTKADLALVVGGYNSSNTSHLVELCEKHFPTYFINSEKEIISDIEIRHFDLHTKLLRTSYSFLPKKNPAKIVLTSGASCPDTLVDRVLIKLLAYFPESLPLEKVLEDF
ncbi:MAG: 4-hydroxy-3-methylbut-2-enyl diphosphate reductase [Bacteroidetes bacterium]|nr:4-hydroxy-3-methylbut-2-enyl diphosphate reductase [Bacteroidota bacterium]MBS1981860.1 4-hydroxy-3-methylbut-2-enyl diphosphate reductase [Bacteroidota bacterium]